MHWIHCYGDHRPHITDATDYTHLAITFMFMQMTIDSITVGTCVANKLYKVLHVHGFKPKQIKEKW